MPPHVPAASVGHAAHAKGPRAACRMKAALVAALLLLAIAVPPVGEADSGDPVLGALAAKGEWKLLEPVRTFGPDNLYEAVSYTHLRAHETRHDLVCRLLLEK